MSLKADWRLGQLDPDADDPFARVILSTGLTVDLSGDLPEIERGLVRSLEIEGSLEARGTTCALKEGGQDCLTCEHYVGDHLEESKAVLCRLGRDQRVLEQTAQRLNRERMAPFREMGAEAERYAEMAPDLDGLPV